MCYEVLKHFNSRKLTWFFFFFFLNLQKYRLYLKGISSGENQQVGEHFHTLNNSRQFHNPNSAFRPFPSGGGMSSRLNTPASVNMHGFQPAKAHANPNHVQRMPISSVASQHPLFSCSLHGKRFNDIWASTTQLPETNSYLPQGVIFNSTSNVPFQGWNKNHNNHVIGSSIGSSTTPVVNVEREGPSKKPHEAYMMSNKMESKSCCISNDICSLEDVIKVMTKQVI
jgi:hypothetical protein